MGKINDFLEGQGQNHSKVIWDWLHKDIYLLYCQLFC